MRALSLCLALLAAAPTVAQQVKVIGPNPAVVTLGGSCTIELRYDGSERVGPPQVPAIPGGRTRVVGPSQQTSMQMDGNGRIVRSQRTSWVVEITPERVGSVVIPPIAIEVGTQTQHTAELTVEVVKEITGQERAYLEVVPSSTRVYVHEPLRFSIDYGVDARLSPAQIRNGIYDVRIQASWLSEFDGAVTLGSEDPAAKLSLVLNDQVQPVVYSPDFRRDGKPFHRFQFHKAFLPSRVGKVELPAPILRYTVITREGVQTFFGPSGEETQTLYAYGEPLTIEVLPLPEAGRPVPYFGAVGRFRIEARSDRTQVKVGNSVELTLTIEGLGNTEFLRVPELTDLAGFHRLGMKVERKEDQVVATYDLTPLQVAVTEIPALRWNYFDTSPEAQRYVELETKALPLQVLPLAEGEALPALPGSEPKPVTPGVDDIFDMKALAGGEPVVLAPRPPAVVGLVAAAGPWFVGGLALFLRTRWLRRRADVAGQRARGAAKRFHRTVAAGTPPIDALVAYLADRLGVADAAVIGPDLMRRLHDAGWSTELVRDTVAAVELGVAARYGGGLALTAAQAQALVDRLAGEPLPAGGAVVLAALLGSLLVAGATAQSDAAATGERAYRAGDYSAAAAAFAEAAQAPDADRRLFYNLGNALYREGKLGAALVAYERARLALPRDDELRANLRLVRQKLELGTGAGEPFLAAVASLRASFTTRELLIASVTCHAIAVVTLLLLRRRQFARGVGVCALLLGVALSVELSWLGPARAGKGFVVVPQAPVVAEPRDGLTPVLTLREGVDVDVLAVGPTWLRVAVQGRSGYMATSSVGIVE